MLSHVRLHLQCKKTYKSLLDELLITMDEELKDSNNRMLLFDSKNKLIINIRFTESTDIYAIQKEEVKGRSDLKLLLFLNHRLIKSIGATLINLVISPNIYLSDDDSYCRSCLFLDQSGLATIDAFTRWWEKYVPVNSIEENTDCFMQIICSILGFMSITRQIDIGDFPKFPNTSDNCSNTEDEHQNIINLFLTYEQSRILHDPALKKIVFGGYGAGKSLIGKTI